MKIAAGLALLLASAAFAQQAAPAPTATLSLRQAVAEAVLRNPNRVRAANEVTAAGFERDAAEWGRFPTISVDAGAGQSSNSVAPNTTVRVEQPLWAGGRIDGQIDAARAQVSAAELAELDTRRRAEVESARAQAVVRKSALYPRLALRFEHFTYPNNGGLTPSSDSRALLVVQFSPDAGLASYSGAQAAQSRIDTALAQLAADEN